MVEPRKDAIIRELEAEVAMIKDRFATLESTNRAQAAEIERLREVAGASRVYLIDQLNAAETRAEKAERALAGGVTEAAVEAALVAYWADDWPHKFSIPNAARATMRAALEAALAAKPDAVAGAAITQEAADAWLTGKGPDPRLTAISQPDAGGEPFEDYHDNGNSGPVASQPKAEPVAWQPQRTATIREKFPKSSEWLWAIHATKEEADRPSGVSRPLYAHPPAAQVGDPDTGAKLIAEWIGSLWDGIRDGRIGDRGYPQWGCDDIGHRKFQGGKQDLRDLAASIAAAQKVGDA